MSGEEEDEYKLFFVYFIAKIKDLELANRLHRVLAFRMEKYQFLQVHTIQMIIQIFKWAMMLRISLNI